MLKYIVHYITKAWRFGVDESDIKYKRYGAGTLRAT